MIDKIFLTDAMAGVSKLQDKSIDLVLTDIPYNTCNNRLEGGLRKINKGDADSLSLSLAELVKLLASKTKGSMYIFCSTEQVSEIRSAMADNGMTTRLCIWEKTNPSPMNGQYLWLSSVECCVFGRFKNATFNERCKSGVWRFPCGRSRVHPTQKPLKLFQYIIETSSKEGDIVLDPFIGSGTTAIASLKTNRHFIGFEINKEYYNVAQRRLDDEICRT